MFNISDLTLHQLLPVFSAEKELRHRLTAMRKRRFHSPGPQEKGLLQRKRDKVLYTVPGNHAWYGALGVREALAWTISHAVRIAAH
jgi:hypothetical protein